MAKTVVVNLRKEDYDEYIGRGSIWGNPFIIGEHGNREHVILRYKHHLRNNRELMSRIMELDGKRLGCYCKPKACHGDAIVETIKWVKQKSTSRKLSGGASAAKNTTTGIKKKSRSGKGRGR